MNDPGPARSKAPLYGLMAATIVGLVGRQLSVVALPWFVLTTTGSASKAGLVGFAVFLPGLIVGVLGGVLVDRFGDKFVSAGADVVCAVATLLIPLLYSTVGLEFWQLLVLVFFSSLLDVPALTARRAMIPDLASLAGISLDRVNALFESLNNLAMLIGTPIAGLLVAWLGARDVLWLDAGASALAALIVLTMVPASVFAKTSFASSGYLADMMAGFRFIRRDPVLWPMAIFLAISNAITVSMAGVILPVYVRDTFGSAASLGVMLAAAGAGAVLGSGLYGMFSNRVSRRLLWYAMHLVVPLEFGIFLTSPAVTAIVIVFFFVGFLSGPANPIMVTIRHERSPAAIRGRVFSTYSAIAMAAQPLGILVAGYMIEGLGFDVTILALAVAGQLLGFVALFVPGFRELDRRPASGTDVPSTATAGSAPRAPR
ncbi:MAG: MFS transporter [Chloroflexota bacterium]|nr:MFS transporter [Chloroflexota bacterium]